MAFSDQYCWFNCFSNRWIFIEAEYYQNRSKVELLSQQVFSEKTNKKSTFWDAATKYASIGKDEHFVEEIAYVMVTLHRTGA